MTRRASANSAAEVNHDPRRHKRPLGLPRALQGRRAALVVAHPGHELRVYHWLKLARPTVFILTDGSGRSGNSRLDRTTSILKHVGAAPGNIYGRVTDAEIYSAIIRRDIPYFVALAGELAECLRDHEIDYVVGDALEGYNPAHDLCRYVTNAAIMSVSRDGELLENYDVLMGNQRHDRAQVNGDRSVLFELDACSVAEKMRMARNYTELQIDVQRVLAEEGMESIKTEQLHYLTDVTFDSSSETPYYELYGRQQVALGHYGELLTCRDHLRPIAEALRTFGAKGRCL